MTPDEIQVAVGGLLNYDWTTDIVEGLDYSCFDQASLDISYENYCVRKKYSEDDKPGHRAFLEAIGATSNGKVTKSGILFLGREFIIREWLGVYEYRFSWRTRSGKLLINDVWDSNLWNSIGRAKKHFNACNSEHEIKFKNK